MATQDLVEADFTENGTSPERIIRGGQAIQKMQTSYATAVAVQRPRKLATVERALMEEAALGGEDFYYGWSVKDGNGKMIRIEGPSVDLALAAARCYGNCVLESMPVIDTGDSWIFTSAFVDLETGFTLTRQFRQSKSHKVYGKMDEERKADIKFQIGQSKSLRNVAINALPPSLINRAMAKAKEGVKAAVEKYVEKNGLAGAANMMLAKLLKAGVKEPAVLERLDIASASAITVDHIVILNGDLAAILSGRDTADSIFPSEAAADRLTDKIKGKEPKRSEPKVEPAPDEGAQPPIDDAEKAALAEQEAQDAAQDAPQGDPEREAKLLKLRKALKKTTGMTEAFASNKFRNGAKTFDELSDEQLGEVAAYIGVK